jgi:lactobin A/cerein 7B family class IIb bacteriocin
MCFYQSIQLYQHKQLKIITTMENLNELGVSRLQAEELVSIEGGWTPVGAAIDTWNRFNDLVVKIFF